MKLDHRVKRDQANALRIQDAARKKLGDAAPAFRPEADIVRGTPGPQLAIADALARERASLGHIKHEPFDAMIEAEILTDCPRRVIWYANRNTHGNIVLEDEEGQLHIQCWTHPAIQLGLTAELEEWADFKRRGYTIRQVRPLARARFHQVLPQISGVYDPGGATAGRPEPAAVHATSGLKAVKLEMTREQVSAFVSRMRGVMVITGAPGTGKTTVALQRVRFMYDQQNLREPDDDSVRYAPPLTAVFLANENLISASREMLERELGIPREVVMHVPEFVSSYLGEVWAHKLEARPRMRKMAPQMRRAREALLNLCTVRDLRGVWQTVEAQARERYGAESRPEWVRVAAEQGSKARARALELARVLSVHPARTSTEPSGSTLRLAAVYRRVRVQYAECRDQLEGESLRRRFDEAFARWLFWVYDPIDVLAQFFRAHRFQQAIHVRTGTGGLLGPDEVVDEVLRDWKARQYCPEDAAWIAWILRFVLPEEADPTDRFRGVPLALPRISDSIGERWTHVVIDEAQDLAVQEASFLGSLVHPRGALTVSADFRQIVSPVHGMTDPNALRVGNQIWDEKLDTQFPFQKNMRQSREIGQFLIAFYQKAFGELAAFAPGDRQDRHKPVLYLAKKSGFADLIATMMRVLGRSKAVRTVALLQIDEDERQMGALRASLQALRVPLAPAEAVSSVDSLVTTSVERAKGLEFDVCVVLGLDEVERSSLNFTKNRAYVALSRPTQRLFMLSEEYPSLLRGVSTDLFEVQKVE